MKLCELRALAGLFKGFGKIQHIKRIGDNLIKLEAHNQSFYFDMARGASCVFSTKEPLIASKKYNAPFDIALSRLNQSEILDCFLLDNDRILRFCLCVRNSYKQSQVFLQFEFSGKYTNVIILEPNEVVLEALRHIPASKSIRFVKVGEILPKMPTNPRGIQQLHSKHITQEEILEILKQNYTKRIQKELCAKRALLLSHLTKQCSKLQEILDALPKKEELLIESREINAKANLLLMHINELKNYQKEVWLKDLQGNDVHIVLPLSSTPQEAINAMFQESKKLAKKSKNLHIQEENLQSKIEFLAQEIAFIQSTNNLDDMQILKTQSQKENQNERFECVFIDGFKISIGRNQNENKILLESAKADDLWLHIKDIPSSHMIIHCGKQKVHDEVIKKAGEILVGLCRIQIGNFCVDYTRRKFVKIIQGANVIYSRQQSFYYRK